jgi:hypothetical protein
MQCRNVVLSLNIPNKPLYTYSYFLPLTVPSYVQVLYYQKYVLYIGSKISSP